MLDTVLVIDDDPALRHLLRLLFDTEGFEVVGAAPYGDTALELARRRPRYVVLGSMITGSAGAKAFRDVAPEAKIVAFSLDLEERPPWADAFLNEARMMDIAPMLIGQLRPQMGGNPGRTA